MDRKKNTGNFFKIPFISSFSTSPAKFSDFDAGNVILFQIKVFGRNIKEITLARKFITVTARHSFMQLRVIRRINEFIKCGNRKYDTKIQLYFLLI